MWSQLALKRFADWCQRNRHRPIAEQHRMVVAKLRGHCQYYGITGNSAALQRFRYEMLCVWRKWLNRRSQRSRLTWERFFHGLLRHYDVPAAKCVHSVYVT